MSKQTRVAVIVLLVLLIGGVGFIAYVRASIHHLGFLTTSDVKVLMSAANEARAAVEHNKSCVLPMDESTKGDRRQEAEMLYIAAMLDLYRAKFGVAARSLSDLDRLRDFDQNSRLDKRRLEKDCFVYVDPSGASVVSCGGSKPSSAGLAKLVPGAEYVQRFYRVGKSEVLYIPVPKC
jgi:hypothetical protein